jgi:demethoxyubiquinone hydroxylase (CLK1/Coq7/Cat5 family)
MIVRERRRIAALVKVASSLDERVQVAEKELVVSDAALRSRLEDHRQDVADLEQRQHDQIICLVDMVNENMSSKDIDFDGDLKSVVLFQKKLLVLANERVSLYVFSLFFIQTHSFKPYTSHSTFSLGRLEGQLAEKRSENTIIHDYEMQINELNHLAVSRSEQCELLKQSESDLRTALRQVRDVITSHLNVVDDDSNIRAAVRIVDSILFTTSKKSSEVSYSVPLSQSDSQNQMFLSPRFKKHIELMHSSDSEYTDDDRDDVTLEVDASTSLMADLALIAKGQVPPSLCSSNLLDAATALSSGKAIFQSSNLTTLVEPASQMEAYTSTSSNVEKAQKRSSSKQMYQSVFDRLGSPSQFTGTQKDKFHDSKARRDRTTESALAEKDLRHEVVSDPIPAHDPRASSAIDRAGYAKQNVFDRLQKTITHAAAIRQSETLHVDFRPQNDGKISESVIFGQDSSANRSNEDENKRSPNEDDHLVEFKYSGESRSAIDRAAYTKQNVFDRLQKTTTLAAAVRQSEKLHLDSRVVTDHKQLISPVSVDSETFSSKKSDGKRSTATSKTLESNDLANLNVFERLNKTTTRAYAKKSCRSGENDSK